MSGSVYAPFTSVGEVFTRQDKAGLQSAHSGVLLTMCVCILPLGPLGGQGQGLVALGKFVKKSRFLVSSASVGCFNPS